LLVTEFPQDRSQKIEIGYACLVRATGAGGLGLHLHVLPM
jgi:hypothetical protein